MREAERQREEAINYAQKVQAESTELRNRMNALDTNYVTEYSTRVQSQMTAAEQEMAKAMEINDTAAVVEAQRKITALAIENDRAEQAKLQQEQLSKQRQQQPQQQPQQTQQPARKPSPKAESWAQKNEWFGQDEAMTYAAFGIHKKLIEEEGFDPNSDEYYTELDRRVQTEFPHKFNGGSKRPAQTVASVSRTTTGRSSSKKVRLTPSQVAIAKKLGVPLEEYAKYVKE
jgi:GH15 family glucan-1,4-alpha-glucosidase